MILLVGGIKGGTGKTTLAVNLAVLEQARGQRVFLIDADAQDTASYFMARRGHDFESAKMKAADIIGQVPKLAKTYDSIIIDAGGGDTQNQRAALSVADVVVVPFVPSAFDMWTLEKLAEIIALGKQANPRLKAYAFINKAESQGDDNEMAADALKSYKDIEYLDLSMGTRKAFRRTTAEGKGIMEMPSSPSQAKGELSLIHQFLFLEKVVR
jgi:chromosome partitioning protein